MPHPSLSRPAFGPMLILACGVLGACARVDVQPIEVKPIHITVDVVIRIDRALDDFFTKPATPPSGAAAPTVAPAPVAVAPVPTAAAAPVAENAAVTTAAPATSEAVAPAVAP